MEVATTTTEAHLSAIHQSLLQISATLGRMTARQDQMLVDWKKRTAAAPFASTATTTPTFGSGPVLEQQMTTSSSSLVFSAGQIVRDGGPHEDAVFASAMPTSCSAKSPAHYTDSSHGELVFPAGDATYSPATTSSGARNCTLVQPAEGIYGFTSVGGSSLFLEIGLDFENEELANTILTRVGDCSIFLEPGMGDQAEVFDAPLTVGTDTVLDHGVGVPSKRCTLQQLLSHEMQQYGTNCDTLVLPWDPGEQKAGITSLFGWRYHAHKCVIQCNLYVLSRSMKDIQSIQFSDHVWGKVPLWMLSGFSPGKCVHQHELRLDNMDSSINEVIMQQLCGIVRVWNPGITALWLSIATPPDHIQLNFVCLLAEYIHGILMCFLLAAMEGKQAWTAQYPWTLNFNEILQVEQAGYNPDQIIHGIFSTLVREPECDITDFCMVGLTIKFLFRALMPLLLNDKYNKFKLATHHRQLECESAGCQPSRALKYKIRAVQQKHGGIDINYGCKDFIFLLGWMDVGMINACWLHLILSWRTQLIWLCCVDTTYTGEPRGVVNVEAKYSQHTGRTIVSVLDHEQNATVFVVIPEFILSLQGQQGLVLLIDREPQAVYWIAIMPVVTWVQVLDEHVQWDPGGFWLITSGERELARQPHCQSGKDKLLRPEHAIAWGQAMFCRGGSVTPSVFLGCTQGMGCRGGLGPTE